MALGTALNYCFLVFVGVIEECSHLLAYGLW